MGHESGRSVVLMDVDPRRGLGALGERLAAEHLERAGYRVLERNFRCRAGELDLVAASERALVFCEVKTRVAGGRAGPAHPLEAIGPNKRRRLRLLAREWLAAQLGERVYRDALRFDAIGVTVNHAGGLLALEHVEDAF
jgi:putative endonuclease